MQQPQVVIPRDSCVAAERFGFIDALRGFAIAGILLVNIPDLTELGSALASTHDDSSAELFMQFAIQSRIVPIFTFMFGMSLYFIKRGALQRGRRAWLGLVCRLGALAGIGYLHSLVYPGEILRTYALFGLLVLPLVLLAPRLVQLIVGIVLTLAAFVFLGGGALATPGLMILGFAAVSYGVPGALEHGTRGVKWVFISAAAVSIPLLWWQSTQPGDPRFQVAGVISAAGILAGGTIAVVYVTGLSLLWNTRARPLLGAGFSSLGRMALTNYVSASIIVSLVGPWFNFPHQVSPATAILLAIGILSIQGVASFLWLQWFRYGPLEWVWRIATWRTYVPIRARESRTRDPLLATG